MLIVFILFMFCSLQVELKDRKHPGAQEPLLAAEVLFILFVFFLKTKPDGEFGD